MTEWVGLVLLLLVGLGIVFTGLPAAVVLVTVASLGAIIGLVAGTIELATLGALPSRLVNLFENDLLQALPLYVTMGLLLDRLPVADALYRASNALLPRKPSAPLVSGMVLGALLGPMNGSVGASVLGLSRVVSPRLAAEGILAANRHAIIAVASTLGVLVPPSLVLILLSDAMLSAHTMAVTATGRSDRVVNTQDIFHAALLPGAIFLLLCLALSFVTGRTAKSLPAREPLAPAEGLLAALALGFLLVLLGGVTVGYFYAVEAAAMGAARRRVRHRTPAARRARQDAGRCHRAIRRAVLAAARGHDVHDDLAAARHRRPGRPAGLVDPGRRDFCGRDRARRDRDLGLRARCLRDHFRDRADRDPAAADPGRHARWVAVLVLLTLQSSFLLPPFGYALMMVRGVLKEQVSFRAMLRALAPFLAAQWLLLLVVLLFPQLTHTRQSAEDSSRAPPAPMSDAEFNRRLQEMIKLPDLDPPGEPR